MIYTPEGGIIKQAIMFNFSATNNKAILSGLGAAEIMELKEFEIISDSKAVSVYITGESMAQGPNMTRYLETIK